MSNETASGILSTLNIGGTDVRLIIDHFSYYESIYEQTAYASIALKDASGFSSLKLDKETEVDFSFGERNGGTIKMKMKIAKSAEGKPVQDKTENITLLAMPHEFINDNGKSVSKKYTGKDSDIVKKIHEEYTKGSNTIKKSLTVSDSKGEKQLAGVGQSPLRQINRQAKEAESAKGGASNYVYFQDRDGYHFKTIDEMIKSNVTNTYAYAQQNIPQGDEKRKILSWDPVKTTDAISAREAGADNTHTYAFDPTTGKTYSLEKGKRNGQGDAAKTGRNEITKADKSEADEKRGILSNFFIAPGGTKSKFRDSRDPNVKKYKRTVDNHASQDTAANQLDNLVINIRVPGDTNIKVGTNVNLQFPATGEANKLDKRSGKFLVTRVHHYVYKDDTDIKYNVVMECKSNSYNESKG